MTTRFMSIAEAEATRFFRGAVNYLELIPEKLTLEQADPVPDVAEVVVRLTPQMCWDASSPMRGTEEVGVNATVEVRLAPKQYCRAPEGYWIGNTHRVYPLPPVRFADLEIHPCYGSGPSNTSNLRYQVSRRIGELSAKLRRVSEQEQKGEPMRRSDRLPEGLSNPDEIASLLDEARRLIEFNALSDTETREVRDDR